MAALAGFELLNQCLTVWNIRTLVLEFLHRQKPAAFEGFIVHGSSWM